jgi:imidazolonepropionase
LTSTVVDELKMLRAARRLGEERAVRIATTLLGAHAVPPDYAGRADAYVDLVCDEMIPAAIGLADAVDAFCEGIGFSPAQTDRVLAAARGAGLPVKLHAEQLSALHGASLAASHGALSADHLEHADEDDARAMAVAGTVAVLLPGAYYFMRETKLPPVAHFREHGVRIAIATDCNPGTSPVTSPLLVLNMACTLFRLTVAEALRGITVNAAYALGLADEIGTLEVGKACDLAIWDIAAPAELVYRIGFNPLHMRVKDGRCC